MKRVKRFLVVNWKLWGGILVLLAVELFCITGITQHIYKIVHTGGGNSGMEFMVAEMLPEKSWQWVGQYMSDSELNSWTSCYEEHDDGYYHLKDSYLERTSMERLEAQFMEAQAVVWYIGQMKKGELEELLASDGDHFTTEYLIVRDLVADVIDGQGEEFMYNCTKSFVQEESGKCGVNLKSVKTEYVLGQLFMILFQLVFSLGCMVGGYFLQRNFIRIIRQRIHEREVALAECTFYCFAVLAWQAFIWYYAGIWQINEMSCSSSLIIFPALLLIVLMMVVYCLRKFNFGLPVCEKWGYQGRMQNKWFGLFSKSILFGFPGFSLVTGILILVSPSLVSAIWMICGDLLIALIAFLLPDLLQSVDGVDSVDDIARDSIVD